MGKVLAVYNNKGGVSKTSTCSNVGAALTVLGKKVLLVDCDPQANLTVSVGVDDESLERTIYDLFKNYNNITKELVTSGTVPTVFNNLEILPSDITLSDAEISLSRHDDREIILKKIIDQVRENYDYILIDCPPSLGLLSINALCAADRLIIPIIPDYFSLKGMKHLLNTYEVIKSNINHDLEILGIVLVKFNNRKKLSKDIKQNLTEAFEDKVFETFIRIDSQIETAQDNLMPVIYFNKRCHAYEDYMNLTHEILGRF